MTAEISNDGVTLGRIGEILLAKADLKQRGKFIQNLTHQTMSKQRELSVLKD